VDRLSPILCPDASKCSAIVLQIHWKVLSLSDKLFNGRNEIEHLNITFDGASGDRATRIDVDLEDDSGDPAKPETPTA
jgi:hypothetical protein